MKSPKTITSRHEFKTALTYQLPTLPQVKVGGNLRWRSKTENDTYAAANQGAYAVLDVMAKYDIDKNWSTQLNLNNVTDTKYLSSLYTYNSNYGAPRNVSASVTWKY